MVEHGRTSLRGTSMCHTSEAKESLEHLGRTVIQRKHRQMVEKETGKDGRDSPEEKTTYLSKATSFSLSRVQAQGGG